MSEFIVALDSQSNYTVGEHVVRRMLAGQIEDVRGRLVHALERLDYQVVSENPLLARRAARKGAVRADFLDYARKLAVSLRPSSAAATVATFGLPNRIIGSVTASRPTEMSRPTTISCKEARDPAVRRATSSSAGSAPVPGAPHSRQKRASPGFSVPQLPQTLAAGGAAPSATTASASSSSVFLSPSVISPLWTTAKSKVATVAAELLGRRETASLRA